MPVGILLVTHGDSGKELISAARTALGGHLPLKARSLRVDSTCDPDVIMEDIKRLHAELDGGGVLILTDLYGSTPYNVSATFYRHNTTHIISGVNLAMLIKIMNYHSLDLAQLTRKALDGGRGGVMEYRR